MAGPTIVSARHYVAAEILRSGLPITIRAVRSDDRPRLVRAFGELAQEWVRERLFSYKSELRSAELSRIAERDFFTDVMLVATMPFEDDEIIIGGARYVAHDAPEGAREADIAFMVEESYQGLGVAGRLLKHLAAIAHLCGISRFVTAVLPENRPMLAVFERSGLPIRRRRSDDAVHVTLTLEQSWQRSAVTQ